jgi:hypothetical protein
VADTFSDVWRRLRLYNPELPNGLAKDFVRRAFREIFRFPHLWSWGYAQDQFVFPASYSTGTIALTNGSATVTGTGTTWTSSHEGLQFKTGSHVFTVSTVASTTSLTLDRNWGLADNASTTYSIFKAYVTTPARFRGFRSVIDPDQGRQLVTNGFTMRDLDRIDPERTSSGDPSALVDFSYSSTGLPMFEVWPHVYDATVLPYLYYRWSTDYAEGDTLPYQFQGDELLEGALSYLCSWPGTRERPNPMYSVRDAGYHREQFQDILHSLARDDEDIYTTGVWRAYLDLPHIAPLDANYIRQHDIVYD